MHFEFIIVHVFVQFPDSQVLIADAVRIEVVVEIKSKIIRLRRIINRVIAMRHRLLSLRRRSDRYEVWARNFRKQRRGAARITHAKVVLSSEMARENCALIMASLSLSLKQESPPWPVTYRKTFVSGVRLSFLLLSSSGLLLPRRVSYSSRTFMLEQRFSSSISVLMFVQSLSMKEIEPGIGFFWQQPGFSGIIRMISLSLKPCSFRNLYTTKRLPPCRQLQQPIDEESSMAAFLLARPMTRNSVTIQTLRIILLLEIFKQIMLSDSKEPSPEATDEAVSTSIIEQAAQQNSPPPQPRVAIICPKHQLPFTQIQVQTQRPVCDECITQMNSIDIESERIKATNRFRQFVEDFRKDNQELEKTRTLFRAGGIAEVRRKVKKGLPQMQETLSKEIETMVAEGNKQIQAAIDKELEMWRFLDQQTISDPSYLPLMLQHKTIFAEQKNKINQLKADIKKKIAERVKSIARAYYSEQFGFA